LTPSGVEELLGGVATNIVINGGHIGCCHTVGSVAFGATTLGVTGAIAAGALGYLVSKVAGPFGAGKRTPFNIATNIIAGAASVGLFGVVTVLKLEEMYFRSCMYVFAYVHVWVHILGFHSQCNTHTSYLSYDKWRKYESPQTA